ncbi:MAG: hypothetical protein LUD27_06495 [Clostridia bacterium]|nr:hypothetical protein [Clostridia bacterium]
MKKFFCLICLFAVFALPSGGCKSKLDYSDYISELRYDVFLYSGDSEEIKVYCSEREAPYAADGIKGEMNGLIEIYAKFEKNYSSVSVDIDGSGGEMSYMTVKDCWYISFSGGFETDSLEATLDTDGKRNEYTLVSVLSEGVMDGKNALECVIEHNGALFESKTENGIFCGEIYIRLLFDERCYYYVGVCGRDKNIQAYLVNGETGRIIAEHSTSA